MAKSAATREAIQALHTLSSQRLDSDDRLFQIEDYLRLNRTEHQHDRAIAITCGTYVEHSLEETISSHFTAEAADEGKKLFIGNHERDAPLGSLYAKASLAHCLGVIGHNTLQDIHNVRIIRNLFAHGGGPIFFARAEVSRVCEFHFVNTAPWGGVMGEKPVTSRDKFLVTCKYFILFLSRAHDKQVPFRYSERLLAPFFR